MLLVMALMIYITEAVVMLILGRIDIHNEWIDVLLDSSMLLLFLTPVYLFFYRPFWEAQKQYQEQIRYLSQQMITTVEDERKRITSELHDQTGQSLTALQFGLQTLKRRLPENDDSLHSLTENSIELTAQLSDNMRAFASRLRPEALDQMGLIATLEVEFRAFSKTYDQIELKHRMVRKEDLSGFLSAVGELAVYRICQEALTNIAKHAEASSVEIFLELDGDHLTLTIVDDGTGFDVRKFWTNRQRGGIGLIGMRERVRQLDGRFDMRSEPGRGTCLSVEIPRQKRNHHGTD